MRKSALILVIYICSALPCFGQVGPDYQLRPLMHWQVGRFAGWSVLPDITQTQPLKTLQVAGWLSKDESGWKELMAGALIGSDGTVQPLVNLRAYSKNPHTDLYAELHLAANRALADTFVTIPLPYQIRVGIESEFLTGLTDKVRSQAGIGPRVSIRILKTNVNVATTCFFNIKSNVAIRTYLVYNFVR